MIFVCKIDDVKFETIKCWDAINSSSLQYNDYCQQLSWNCNTLKYVFLESCLQKVEGFKILLIDDSKPTWKHDEYSLNQCYTWLCKNIECRVGWGGGKLPYTRF